MSPSSAVTPEMIRRGVFRQRGNLTQSESASQFAEPDLSQGYDPAHVADASAREPTLPARYSLATVGDASVDQSGPSLKSRILAGLSAGLTGLGQTFDASAGGAEGFLGSLGQGYSNTQDAMYGTPGEQMARQIRSQALGRQAKQDQQEAEYRRAQIEHLNAQTQHDLEPATPARPYRLPKSPEERTLDAAEYDRRQREERLHPKPGQRLPPTPQETLNYAQDAALSVVRAADGNPTEITRRIQSNPTLREMARKGQLSQDVIDEANTRYRLEKANAGIRQTQANEAQTKQKFLEDALGGAGTPTPITQPSDSPPTKRRHLPGNPFAP